jgi:hypothetical protein
VNAKKRKLNWIGKLRMELRSRIGSAAAETLPAVLTTHKQRREDAVALRRVAAQLEVKAFHRNHLWR